MSAASSPKGLGSARFDLLDRHNALPDLIKAALIEHYRWYLEGDCVDLEQIKNEGGLLKADRVKGIAVRYNISRNLRLGEESKKLIQDSSERCKRMLERHRKLNDALEKARGDWPVTLLGRAETCANLADELNKDDGNPVASKTGTPVSASTKLMWFIKPDGWTVFDRLASRALLSESSDTTIGRMKFFYESLHDRGFERDCLAMQPLIDKSIFNGLFAPRVIDAVLFLTGMQEGKRKNRMDDNRVFMNSGLPADVGMKLQILGEEIAETFYRTLLQPMHSRNI